MCAAEEWQTVGGPPELPAAPWPNSPGWARWKERAAALALAASVVALAVPAVALIGARAEVGGSVTVASGAPLVAEAELFAPTTTSTTTLPPETTSTTLDPGPTPTEEPSTTTTTEAPPAAPRPDPPPRPKPPSPPTTAAPSLPNVVGMSETNAVATLSGAGYLVATEYRVAPASVGVVISQTGSGAVTITVGIAPPAEVPEVPLEEAPAEGAP